jgi:hypothetical protein
LTCAFAIGAEAVSSALLVALGRRRWSMTPLLTVASPSAKHRGTQRITDMRRTSQTARLTRGREGTEAATADSVEMTDNSPCSDTVSEPSRRCQDTRQARESVSPLGFTSADAITPLLARRVGAWPPVSLLAPRTTSAKRSAVS